MSPPAGLRVNRRALASSDVTHRRGLAVTTPLRTALDLARIRPLDEAVVALDQYLRPGYVLLSEVRATKQAVGRDCRHVRMAAALADGLAESPRAQRRHVDTSTARHGDSRVEAPHRRT